MKAAWPTAAQRVAQMNAQSEAASPAVASLALGHMAQAMQEFETQGLRTDAASMAAPSTSGANKAANVQSLQDPAHSGFLALPGS